MYSYNEELLGGNRNKSWFSFNFIIYGVSLICAINSILYGDPANAIFFMLFSVVAYLISKYERYRESTHSKFKSKNYTDDIEKFKLNGIPMGAFLEGEYMLVRGLLFTHVDHEDSSTRNYFAERKIYYKDIKGCYKASHNLYFVFNDKYSGNNRCEKLFVSDFFDNSNELLKEIESRMTTKESNKNVYRLRRPQ